MTSTPLSAVARKFFMTSIWCRGSSEAVGSSARMTGASTASARASATRLRSPPDNSVTRRSLNSITSTACIARSTASASFGDSRAGSVAPCG